MPTSRFVNAVPSMRMNRPPPSSPLPPIPPLVGPTPPTREKYTVQRAKRAQGTRKRGSRRGQFNLHHDLIGPCSTSSFFLLLPSRPVVPNSNQQPARPSLCLCLKIVHRNDSERHPSPGMLALAQITQVMMTVMVNNPKKKPSIA